MASPSPGGPPGAQGSNSPERVFCHACGNEWTKDDRGLACPHCQSEATEIMTPESNVREFYDIPDSPSSSSDHHARPRRRYSSDSDPDEADIEDLMRGSRAPDPFAQRDGWPNRGPDSPGPYGRFPPDGNDGDQIMDRFYQMLSAFGAPRPDAPPQDQGWGQPRQFGGGGGGGAFGNAGRGGNIRTFTSRTGNGFTSFTIATGPIHINAGGGRRLGARAEGDQDHDDFNTVFGDLLGGTGPPQGPGGARGPGQAPNLAASLAQLLSLLTPGNGQYGDAVYTQEALDRIVSAMMEQNPQSNAAPPASEDAINKLEKKTVDEAMLGPEGKAECTICIEELKKGDIVVYLPCKHWFHEECAHMWLREHNTCPICRAPIEESNNNQNQGGGAQPGADSGPGATGGPRSPGAGFEDFAPPPFPPPGHGGPSPGGQGPSWGAHSPPPPNASTRPAGTHTWRWSFTYPPRPSPPQAPTSDRNGSRMPSGYNINLPRPRRTSHSPPAAAAGYRARQRSPTPSNWDRARGQEEPDQHQQGSGPWSWLRNQFSRASSSGSGMGDRSHERRRQ